MFELTKKEAYRGIALKKVWILLGFLLVFIIFNLQHISAGPTIYYYPNTSDILSPNTDLDLGVNDDFNMQCSSTSHLTDGVNNVPYNWEAYLEYNTTSSSFESIPTSGSIDLVANGSNPDIEPAPTSTPTTINFATHLVTAYDPDTYWVRCRISNTYNYNNISSATKKITVSSGPTDNPPTVTLNSPEDYANFSSTIDFNCTADDDIKLENVSLYGNWTGTWLLNETNSTPVNATPVIFSKTISDGHYLWNCQACDNATSTQCSFATSNRTFTVDTTAPTITLPIYSNATTKKSSDSLTLNISVSDSGIGVDSCIVNVATATAGNQTISYSNGWCNGTYSLAETSGGNRTINAYANDTLNNWALNNSYVVWIDNTGPSMNNEGSNETAINQSEYFCLNITATDTASGVDTVYAEVWDTSSWSNYTMSEDGTSCDGAPDDGVYGVEIQGTNIGLWNYSKTYANDTLNNWNSYDFADLTINVTTPPDTAYPQFSNFQEAPANNSDYSYGQSYQFNSTVTYTNGTVYLSFDGTNYSASNVSDEFYVNLASLSADTYNYYWWGYGNGTNENYNSSDTRVYIVKKINPDASLTNNDSWTITYPTTVQIGYGESNNGDGDVTYKVYRDNVDKESGETILLGYGNYNYVLNTTGGTNYTANSSIDAETLTVQQNTGACDVLFNESSGIIYPAIFKVWTNCNTAFTLYRNGTTISNNSEQNLAASTYNFTVIRTDTANYSNYYDEETFTVQQGIGEVATYIDNTRDNESVLFHSEKWLNATLITGIGNIELWYNDTLINQGASPLSNLTNFTQEGEFNVSGIYDGNENYTSDIETWWVTVSSDSAPTVTLNSPIDYYNSSLNLITFNCTADDDINLVNVSLYGNWTGSGWHLNETNSSPVNNEPVIFNKTISEGIYIWNCKACDSISQCSFASANYTFTVDTTYPTFSGYARNPDPPNEDQNIQVNVTVTETNLDKVILEWGGATNYTITTSSGDEYYYTILQGNYTAHDGITYYWYANDTAGNMNKSSQQGFTVANQIPTLSPVPSLNSTSPKTNDLIKCNNGTFQDNDEEDNPQNVEWKWYKDDTEISGETAQTLDLSTAGNGDKGDVIKCSERVYDNYNWSNWYNSSNTATINNTAPTITNPQTTVSRDANGSAYNYDYDATDPDSGDGQIWYDNTTTLFDINPSTGIISDIPTEDQAGSYEIRISVSDGTVNATDDFTYTINDVTSPSIDFQPPTEENESQLTRDYIQANVTASDTNGIDTITVYLYNQTSLVNQTTNPTSPYFVNFTNLPDEFYYFNATVNDTFGNENSTETRTVSTDTGAPTINYVLPTENSGVYESQNYVEVNVTASDPNLDKIVIRLYNSSHIQIDSATTSSSPNFANFTSLSDNLYYYNATANDTFGNDDSLETRNITLDTINPQIEFTTGTEDNDTAFSRNWIFVNVSVTEDNFENITYRLYNSTGEVNITIYTSLITNINWTSLSDDVYTYNVTVVDIVNNQNTTDTRYITLDNANPQIYYNPNTDANDSFVDRNWVFINVTASDLTKDSVQFEWNGINETFDNNNGDLYWENKTGLSDGSYSFYAWINDSSGNFNSTSNRTVTVDISNPSITNIIESPTDPATYSEGAIYQFNATITDDNLDTVSIEFDGTNYTPTQTGDIYNLTLSDLAVDTYNYYWWANDTAGNVNQTSDTYTINQNTAACDVLFNETSPKTYPVIFKVWTNCNSGFTLYRNSTTISNNSEQNLAASAYNFSVIRDDTVNYSNYYDEESFTINNATGNITLLINGSASNQSGAYGTQTNASASTLYGSVTLYRNGTEITSENNAYVTLAADYYNYTAVSSGDQNHSSASITRFVDISKATSEVNLTLNGTDGNVTINQYSSIYLNGTLITGDTSATLKLYKAGTLINQGVSPLSNLTSFPSIGVFNITVFYIESQNYTGSYETWWVNVTEAPDTENPSVSSLTESPTDPATYSPGQKYEFNATVTDNGQIDIVLLDFNGTNYTATNLTADVYNVTLIGLSVEVYDYRWYANDSAGNMNSTENGTYTISQATPSLNLIITPSTSEEYGTETTANGTGCPTQLDCNLYRNDTGEVTPPDVVTLGVGAYNYTYNTTGNANYTSASTSDILTISKATGACDVLFNESSGITYPATFRVWTNCNSDFTLYRNSTTISNNSEQNLAASTYNFTVIRTDTANYSNYYDEETFTVQQATGVVYAYLDNSGANKTIEQYTEIWLNATLETGSGTIKLYNNGTLINQGVSPLSNLTNFTEIYLYNITAIYDGNENYTSDSETWWVNVTEADTTPPQISITHPENTSYNSVQTQLNYTVTDNFGLDQVTCWYSTNNGAKNTTIDCNENVTDLNSGQDSSTWIVYANDSKGNENSSSVTFFVDSIDPTIDFASPTETSGSSLGRNYIQINVTANDTNLDIITIYLYNSTSLVNQTTNSTSPFFINYTGLSADTYYFNATVNDSVNNGVSTSTRNVSLVVPTLTIILPENETYIDTTDLLLEYTVDYEDYVKYNIDQTGGNETITGNTTFNTSSDSHTLYLYANNTLGEIVENVIFTVNESKFKIHYINYSGENKGSSTDFNQSSYEDIQNLSGIIFENTDWGKISFNEAINVTDDANISDNGADLDTYTNISENHIEIDSSALPNFNKSATLYLYNLTFSNPRILRDGELCLDTICTDKTYSRGTGTLRFNITHFTVYSAEETPVTPSEEEAETGGGGGVACTKDKDCKEDEICWNGACAKLFDIKIIDFDSPVKLGEFFEFTYFVKGMAKINGDVEIFFWIEKNGEIVTSGSDTIYLGSFEERTETTKIFLPTNIKSGIYQFYVKVHHQAYSAQSYRTIEIQVKGGVATIGAIEWGAIQKYLVIALIILAVLILSTIFYLERKKIKKNIERGFAQEVKWFKKHKIFVLTILLIIVLSLIIYFSGVIPFLSKFIFKLYLLFKTKISPYLFKILILIIILILILSLFRNLRKKRFFEKIGEKRRKKKILKKTRKKYKKKAGEKIERFFRALSKEGEKDSKIIRKKLRALAEDFMAIMNQTDKKIVQGLEKDSKIIGKKISGLEKDLRKSEMPEIGAKKEFGELEKLRKIKWPELKLPRFKLPKFSLKKEEKIGKKMIKSLKRNEKILAKLVKRGGLDFEKALKKGEREIGRSAKEVSRLIEEMHNEVLHALTIVFGKKTRKSLIHDFEKAFSREKIRKKRYSELLKELARIKRKMEKGGHLTEKKIINLRKKVNEFIKDLHIYFKKMHLSEIPELKINLKIKKPVLNVKEKMKEIDKNVIRLFSPKRRKTEDALKEFFKKAKEQEFTEEGQGNIKQEIPKEKPLEKEKFYQKPESVQTKEPEENLDIIEDMARKEKEKRKPKA